MLFIHDVTASLVLHESTLAFSFSFISKLLFVDANVKFTT